MEMNDASTLTALGSTIRRWRKQRKCSQLLLADMAGLSTRHLSFIECGKSKPSREALTRLIEALVVPPMQLNELLELAGYSRSEDEDGLDLEFDEGHARWQLDYMLNFFEPYPAFVLDHHLNYVKGNQAFEKMSEKLRYSIYYLDGKVNALLNLAHPLSLRRYLENWPEILQHMHWRLQRHARLHREDPFYDRLNRELLTMGGVSEVLNSRSAGESVLHGIVNIVVQIEGQRLEFTRATTSFQGPVHNGRSTHYLLESFMPANQRTAKISRDKLFPVDPFNIV